MLRFLLLLFFPMASFASSNDTLVWCHQTVSGSASSEAEAVAILEREDYLRVTDAAVLQHRRIKRRTVDVGRDAHDDEPLYYHFQGRQMTGTATATANAPTPSASTPESDTALFHLLLMGLFVSMASLGCIFWFAVTAFLSNQMKDKQYLLLLEEEYNQKQALKAIMEMEKQMENNTVHEQSNNQVGQEHTSYQIGQGQYSSQAGQGQYHTQETSNSQADQEQYNNQVDYGEYYNQVDHGQYSENAQDPFHNQDAYDQYSNQVGPGQYYSQAGREPLNNHANQWLYNIEGNLHQFSSQNMQEEQNTEGLAQYTGEDSTFTSAVEPSMSAPSSTVAPSAPTNTMYRPQASTSTTTTMTTRPTQSTTTLGPGERKINPLFLKGLSEDVFVDENNNNNDNNRRSDDDVGNDVIVLKQFPPFKHSRRFPASGAVFFVAPSSQSEYSPPKYRFRVSVSLVDGAACDSGSTCSVYSSLWSDTTAAAEENLRADAPVKCVFKCRTGSCNGQSSGKK